MPLYAIGDVRGDADRLVRILVAHDLIEISETRTFEWKKPDVAVLFMGNLLDARSRVSAFGDMAFEGSRSDMWILEFLREASERAAEKGARVFALLGARELANVHGDFSETSTYHLGDRDRRRAYFGPEGSGRRILRDLFVTSFTHNGVLYTHAGLPLDPTPFQKIAMNKRVADTLLREDARKEMEGLVAHEQYASSVAPDRAAQEKLNTALRRRQVRAMVIGHVFAEPGSGERGVRVGWDGRVVYTNVALSRAMTISSTRASSSVAYDPGDGRLRALYADGSSERLGVPDTTA